MTHWRGWARGLKTNTYALYLAYRHPKTPWYAKIWAACVVAYAFSPLDLIPDFIPVLGYVDDLLLLPLGIALAVKLIPREVMAECRAQAQRNQQASKPVNWIAAGVILVVWIVLAWAGVTVLVRVAHGE